MQNTSPFPTSESASSSAGMGSGTSETSTMHSSTDSATGSETVRRGVDTAGAALHSTIDKVANPARNAVDGMSSAAHQTVDKLASSANHTAERFSEQTRSISEAPARAVEASRSWIQDRPFEAIGAALAFGFIVGRLTGR